MQHRMESDAEEGREERVPLNPTRPRANGDASTAFAHQLRRDRQHRPDDREERLQLRHLGRAPSSHLAEVLPLVGNELDHPVAIKLIEGVDYIDLTQAGLSCVLLLKSTQAKDELVGGRLDVDRHLDGSEETKEDGLGVLHHRGRDKPMHGAAHANGPHRLQLAPADLPLFQGDQPRS